MKLRRLIAAPFELAVLAAVVIWLALKERRNPRPPRPADDFAAWESEFATTGRTP